MYTLGSKAVIINDVSLITVTGWSLSIPGFGFIDNTDPGYTKVKTTGIQNSFSAIDLAAAGFVSGTEIAIYWTSLRYIGEGVSNMSAPQAPTVIPFPSTVSTIAEAWELYQESFGESELFDLSAPATLKSKNVAINIVKSSIRTIIDPTVDVMAYQTGFRYNKFGGTVGVAGVTNGSEGIGNGFQVEESVRTSNFDATDPYSTKAHGSQEVILNGLYDIYDITVDNMGPYDAFNIHENLAQHIPDEFVKNRPIKYRIYALQGDASDIIDQFVLTPPVISVQPSYAEGLYNDGSYERWLVDGGGAKTDGRAMTWTPTEGVPNILCASVVGEYPATFIGTDEAGQTTPPTSSAIFFKDILPPIFDQLPTDDVYLDDCIEPVVEELTAVSSVNTPAAVSHVILPRSGGCPTGVSYEIVYTATDECGNTTSASTFVHVDDLTPPTVEVAAGNLTVVDDGSGNNAEFTAWLNINGGFDAADNCSAVTYTNDAVPPTGVSVTTVIFTATDACGNTTTSTATFTINP